MHSDKRNTYCAGCGWKTYRWGVEFFLSVSIMKCRRPILNYCDTTHSFPHVLMRRLVVFIMIRNTRSVHISSCWVGSVLFLSIPKWRWSSSFFLARGSGINHWQPHERCSHSSDAKYKPCLGIRWDRRSLMPLSCPFGCEDFISFFIVCGSWIGASYF